ASLPTASGGRGAPKRTRRPEEWSASVGAEARSAEARVVAVVPVLMAESGLGTRRDLAKPLLSGLTPLRMMLLRLARCRRLSAAVLLTEDPEATRRLAGGDVPGLALRIERADLESMRARRRAIGPARLWAESCWRGGIGGFTAFDELL